MVNTRGRIRSFIEAAEMGTEKVIKEHATIGMLVTTDGTIGEISRESYVPAEERVVKELKEIGKPFAVILNSADPSRPESVALAYELEAKYNVPVALVSCIDLDAEDIRIFLSLCCTNFRHRESVFPHGFVNRFRTVRCSVNDAVNRARTKSKTSEMAKRHSALLCATLSNPST